MFELFLKFNGQTAVHLTAKKVKDSDNYAVSTRNPQSPRPKPLGEINFEEDEGVAIFMRRMIELFEEVSAVA